jgi:glycosyltransferase involved in cell wall biosynthesis
MTTGDARGAAAQREQEVTRLGIVAQLPPTPTGPADYVAGLLPYLGARADITCFVPDVSVVDPALRERYDVRPISERDDTSIDVLIYQLANSPLHLEIAEAARSGPPGLVVLHDAVMHHGYAPSADRGRSSTYRRHLGEAHGDAGTAIADLRLIGERGEIELFVFDMLQPLLEVQRGAVAHSEYCAAIARDAVPGLRTWVIPHFAKVSNISVDRADLDLPADRILIGELGFITPAKRPDLFLRAVALLIERGHPVHAVLAGEDLTYGPLDHAINELRLGEHVTVTGFLDEDKLDAYAAAVDICVSLRWPHVGETSGTLIRALAAARPVVVSDVGSWAELPRDAAIRIDDGPDEATALADAIERLVVDAGLRMRIGEAGRSYIDRVADPDRVADLYLEAAREAVSDVPPALSGRTLEIPRDGLVECDRPAMHDRVVIALLPDEPGRARAVLSRANHCLVPNGIVEVTDPGIWETDDVAAFLEDEGFRVTEPLAGVKVMLPATRPLLPL